MWRSWITCATHTKRTCLARPVVCLNRTLTSFENAMFSLADGQVVFSKIFNFSTTYRMAQAQNEWNGIEVPIWKTVFITCVCYLYKLTPTIFFKLVNLVLVMRPLTDHVYFVGIASKNWPNLLQHAMHIAIFSLNSLAMFFVSNSASETGFM